MPPKRASSAISGSIFEIFGLRLKKIRKKFENGIYALIRTTMPSWDEAIFLSLVDNWSQGAIFVRKSEEMSFSHTLKKQLLEGVPDKSWRAVFPCLLHSFLAWKNHVNRSINCHTTYILNSFSMVLKLFEEIYHGNSMEIQWNTGV